MARWPASCCSDLIVDGSSPWEAVYDPARKTPSGILNFVRENVTAIKNFAEYMLPGELELGRRAAARARAASSATGCARSPPAATSRASFTCTPPSARISAVIVHWNSTEQCWDCPCHGSQFAPDGAVLNGPAIAPLKKVQLAGVSRSSSEGRGR